MTSEPIRDPRGDHLLTPQNCALVIIDYQPTQVTSIRSSTRSAIRRLMDAAFDGVSDDTFENVLGGVHALVVEEGELVGQMAVPAAC